LDAGYVYDNACDNCFAQEHPKKNTNLPSSGKVSLSSARARARTHTHTQKASSKLT